MPSKISDQITGSLKTLIAVAAKIVEFKAFYITIMLGGLLYLIANAPTINAPTEQVYAYALISLLGITWAATAGINLDTLNWRASKLWNGKLIKSPQKTHWIILVGVIAAVLTAVIVHLFQDISIDVALGAAGRREVALQQLFIITLPETVIFQGILPLVILHWIYPQASMVDKITKRISPGVYATRTQWAVAYIMSQAGFAIMHNFVYGGDVMAMIRVGALGGIWLYLYRHLGAGTAWGSHFGWNISVLGLITLGGI